MVPPATIIDRDPATVGVFGLGNILMGDDALGPTVIGYVRASLTVPERVAVEDLGTPGLDLYTHLAPFDAVVLVDTVRDEGPPGTVRSYERDEILRHPPGPKLSPHDPGLKETLLTFDFTGLGPREVVLVGVVPGDVDYRVGLTPAVRSSVQRCVELIEEALERFGVDVIGRRSQPPALWWEKEVSMP